MKNPSELIFAAGMTRASEETPIAVQYDLLLVAFLYRRGDGMIEAAQANMVCNVTSRYIASILIGRSIYTDVELIIDEIQRTYMGISRQALVLCVKDAYTKIYERGGIMDEVPKDKFNNIDKIQPEDDSEKCRISQKDVDKLNTSVYHRRQGSQFVGGRIPTNSICIVGLSKTGSKNPITHVHVSLVASFILDAETGLIHQVEFNTICSITNWFLSKLIVGHNLNTDLDCMIALVQQRYMGDSRKAILVILRDAHNKYLGYCQRNKI